MKRLLPSEDIPVFTAPVQGVWRVVNSPGHARFAFDLAAVDPGTGSTLRTSRLAHILGQASVRDSFSWGKPIRSPASGIVRLVSREVPDRESLGLVRDAARMLSAPPLRAADNIQSFAGNYVIIDAQGCFIFIAHLRCGSVRVAVDEKVDAGQVLGEVGNSGLTLEPHLHIQLLDQIDNLLAAAAPPFQIDAFAVLVDGGWTAASTNILPKGKIVRFDSGLGGAFSQEGKTV